MMSSIIENKGNGRFEIKPLPEQCQWAPIYGMLTEDFNQDGHEDIMMIGNDFSAELLNGKYDALNGLILLGNGKGGFRVLSVQESGIFIPGDAKALVTMNLQGEGLFIASGNRGNLKAFKISQPQNLRTLQLKPDDYKVIVTLKNGRKIVKEIYYGNGFISQSSRLIRIPSDCLEVEILNFKNVPRKLIVKEGLS